MVRYIKRIHGGKMKDLIDIIRKEVTNKILEEINAPVGSELHKSYIDFMTFKKIFYLSLMNIEIEQVKEKWGNLK